VRANDLSPVPGSTHKRKRLGRGNASGHGTYSTRGVKGQQSRSGRDLRIGFEGGQNPLVRALSRRRGFTNRFRIDYEAINVGALAKLPAGSDVTSASLRAAGIAKSAVRPVKILGDGELTVKLNVEVEKISAGARAKIEAAGGKAIALTPTKEKKVRRTPEPRAAAAPARAARAAAAAGAVSEPVAEAPVTEAPTVEAPGAAEAPAEAAKPTRRPRAPRAKAAPEAVQESAASETTET
jgi:large subunit ribosomal protein L15